MLRTLTLLMAAGGLVALHLGLQAPTPSREASGPASAVKLGAAASPYTPVSLEAARSWAKGPATRPLPADHGSLQARIAREVRKEAGRLADLDDETRCLAEAVFHESRGEPLKGQLAVAQVVLNRVERSDTSICGVVFEQRASRCQFSFACDPDRAAERGEDWVIARAVAQLALDGRVPDVTGNATHFHATRVSPSWRNVYHRTLAVGQHVFYRAI
jgi:hypothetical protein